MICEGNPRAKLLPDAVSYRCDMPPRRHARKWPLRQQLKSTAAVPTDRETKVTLRLGYLTQRHHRAASSANRERQFEKALGSETSTSRTSIQLGHDETTRQSRPTRRAAFVRPQAPNPRSTAYPEVARHPTALVAGTRQGGALVVQP